MRKLKIPIEVTHEGNGAAARLSELGLSVDLVMDAVTYGQLQRDECTKLDPPTFPGTTGWATTIRAFRGKVADLHWTFSNTANFCTATNPTGEWSVAISTGDKGTGVASKNSNFKNKRGTSTRRAVEQNQYSLFGMLRVETPAASLSKTWILLIGRAGDYVYSEMKLPRVLDEDGRIEAWAERIILPMIKLGEAPKVSKLPEGGAGDEINIDVARRASK